MITDADQGMPLPRQCQIGIHMAIIFRIGIAIKDRSKA